jgi:hypothetical protein
MPNTRLDRHKVRFRPLSERTNRIDIVRDHVSPQDQPQAISESLQTVVAETVMNIVRARETGASRIAAFGAHALKNGLAPVFIKLIEDGWITHLATNGAGVIHDWEFAHLGRSSEHVADNVDRGEFGVWEETGFYINLAILVGAYGGLGYGESVGVMIQEEGLDIPSEEALKDTVANTMDTDADRAAAAADLLDAVRSFSIVPGRLEIPHSFKQFSLQAAAYRLGIPFTAHPMIGHDIIYAHPINSCAAIGRTAERDFLTFAGSVSNIDGGVYLSIGSAVMSPMVFEKSMSMAQNLAVQRNEHIDNHFMVVVDLAESRWDWQKGEPPPESPDYYLRYMKTFSRMGGTARYVAADNRDFLLALLHGLEDI